MKLAVIHHGADKAAWIGRYLLADICAVVEAAGHAVLHLRGCSRFEQADGALLHVDLSLVPDEYVALGRRYPVLLNGALTDTRKSRISQARLLPGERCDGPVIVKTDLNFGGLPERARLPRWRALARKLGFDRGERTASLHYPIFESLDAVPPRLRASPDHVIERFMPEREGSNYFVRHAYFLGERAIAWRLRSKAPIIRAHTVVEDCEVLLPRAIEDYRRKLGLDYGKIDYVEHGGKATVLDVNKTIGGRGSAPQTVARLAPGLVEVLRRGDMNSDSAHG